MTRPLLAESPARLADVLGGAGRSRMVFRALARGEDPHAPSVLPEGLRRRVADATAPIRTVERARSVAADGTVKLLLEVGGHQVECVLIPERSRTTLCVSSQRGCARGCAFCLTAELGLEANLAPEDVVAQVHHGIRVVEQLRMPPLRNLVFMGMGEPLDNWRAVRPAIDVLVDGRGFGFGPRHVTVSTVGPSPRAIERLAGCPTRLAWSLHAARDEVRRSLVSTQRHPVELLRDAFSAVFATRKDPLFVEITLMEGVNDAPLDATAVLQLFDGFPREVRFNLLPMNPSRDGLRPSPPDRVERFAAELRRAGRFAMVRRARGQDALAACGQLARIVSPPARRPRPAP